MPHIVRSLAFATQPSRETNDHEVRILINGDDILERPFDSMGLDPPDFFGQSALFQGGRLRIGRCSSCGVVGCQDCETNVVIGETSVTWEGWGYEFLFPIEAYRRWVSSASTDRSWEDVNRRAERVVAEVLAGMRLAGGGHFRWASARIEPRFIEVSFDNEGRQSLSRFGWDGTNAETAFLAAQRFRRDHEI